MWLQQRILKMIDILKYALFVKLININLRLIQLILNMDKVGLQHWLLRSGEASREIRNIDGGFSEWLDN